MMGHISVTLRAIVLHAAIAFLLFSTLFVSYSGFVEAHIVPKWYAFIAGTVLLALVCSATFDRRRIEISLSYIDISVGVFLGYLLLRMCLAGTPSISILALTSFILLYFIFRVIHKDEIRYFGIIVVCLCIAQALYGIGQWAGVFPVATGFRMTGSFDNPAGLAACLVVGFPFCFAFGKQSKTLKIIGYLCIVIIAVAVILSGSRAGILSITVVSVVYLVDKYRQLIKKRLKVAVIFSTLFALFSIGLIFLKKDSAAGRMLIWRNSLEMTVDKPVFGYGPGGFSSQYMLYQAGYFEANPDSRYVQLADNVTHPFNEYLLLTVEYGLLGLLLLIFVILVVLRSERKLSIPILCLLSITVFSCFSYPLRYPFIWILIVYSLTNLTSRLAMKNLKITLHSLFIRSVLLLSTIAITVFLVGDIRFEYEWGKLTRGEAFGDKDELIESYDLLYKIWNGDPLFLYNYGAVLNRSGCYTESDRIISECEKWLNDYDVQMLLADDNFQMENWGIAEKHYILASNMIPNRFLPLGCLMELYQITGNQDQALEIAEEIAAKEIKVPSSTVYSIIRKAEKLIVEKASVLAD